MLQSRPWFIVLLMILKKIVEKRLIMQIEFKLYHVYSHYIVKSTKNWNIFLVFESDYPIQQSHSPLKSEYSSDIHSVKAANGFSLVYTVCMRLRSNLRINCIPDFMTTNYWIKHCGSGCSAICQIMVKLRLYFG